MCQQVTVKRVIAIEPDHLNSWFIQERNTVMLLRDAKLCIVEIEQKQAIWCLLINFLFFFTKSKGPRNHADLWRKKRHSCDVDLLYEMI